LRIPALAAFRQHTAAYMIMAKALFAGTTGKSFQV